MNCMTVHWLKGLITINLINIYTPGGLLKEIQENILENLSYMNVFGFNFFFGES